MDLEQILDVICLFVMVLGLLALLFVCVLLTYKSEKEYKELRNKELKVRIKLYEFIIDKYNFDELV